MSPVGQRRLTSPSPQRAAPRITSPTNQDLVYDPNTRSFLPAIEILAIEQRIYNAANQPVKKKKKIAPHQATGTHLADRTVGGRPRGTAVDAIEAAASQQSAPVKSVPEPIPASVTEPVSVSVAPGSQAAAVPKRKKKKRVVVSDSDSDQGSYVPNSSDNDSDISARPATFKTRAGALLVKKPSIVREDREREEKEDDTPTRAKASESLTRLDTNPATARTISPTPLPRSAVGRGHGRGQALASAAFAQGR
jgi:serine/arginine repetitive matrix protein 2